MAKKPGSKSAHQERYWTNIIEQARAHPEGVKAYCEEIGISVHTYYGWFRKLRVKHPVWENLPNSPAFSARTNGSAHSEPETEVVERPIRRNFTAGYKSKILREVENAAPGAVGAILRREGLYSSHLQKWRAEESRREQEARKRGPKTNPLEAEVKRLRAENARLEKRLTKAGHIIELQKKIAEIMGIDAEAPQDDY